MLSALALIRRWILRRIRPVRERRRWKPPPGKAYSICPHLFDEIIRILREVRTEIGPGHVIILRGGSALDLGVVAVPMDRGRNSSVSEGLQSSRV